jgi:sporulation protein YlmC with PRC-barrel domain
MTPDGPIKLVSELLDLPLIDSDGCYCGIVDDVEFSGGAGKDLKLKALLVGPGAYAGRMPAVAMAIVKAVAGNRLVRVPLDGVRTITDAVHLECPGRDLGLHRDEMRVGRWIPRKGAL